MKATSATTVRRPFAGRERDFRLRIGEIGELERICGAGIGAIAMRLAHHQFYAADVWDTLRLGLEGGGTPEIEASALLLRYKEGPIADYIGLAGDIIGAAISGIPVGNADAESQQSPATSPNSTPPGE
jgi:hypothetical protein